MTTAPESMGERYVRAMESAGRYVNGIQPRQWHDPTPCTEWDVRQLVAHITYENLWAGELFAGKTMPEVGDRFEGDILGDDPTGAFNRSVEVAKAAALRPGAMDAMTHLSFGDTPGREYASQLFQDLLIHGWDVAQATGQDARLAPELIEACWPLAEQTVAQFGASGMFGSKQEVPEGEGRQTMLLAMLGRREDWRP